MFDLSALPNKRVGSFSVFLICFHGDRKHVAAFESGVGKIVFFERAILTYRK